MRNISRSKWYSAKIDDFLKAETESSIFLELYKSEIVRIEKAYPEVEIAVGPMLSHKDHRLSCIVTRKD